MGHIWDKICHILRFKTREKSTCFISMPPKRAWFWYRRIFQRTKWRYWCSDLGSDFSYATSYLNVSTDLWELLCSFQSNGSTRTIRLEPWLRHGMPRNIQMTYLAFGLLVDKEPILIFNLIIWILNLMVLVVGIGTVRKNLSYVFSEICNMFWFWKKLVDKKFRFRRNILRQWTAK